jgi:hypothetical protein
VGIFADFPGLGADGPHPNGANPAQLSGPGLCGSGDGKAKSRGRRQRLHSTH